MTEWIVGAGLLLVAWYAGACWWYPLADCWCCGGSGRHKSRSGRTSRTCRVCHGKGRWFRVGRRLWHWFRGTGA